jgi:hypothetical protein
VKTDDFVLFLSKDVPRVDRKQQACAIAFVLLAGAFAALTILLSLSTINPNLISMSGMVWFWIRFGFLVAMGAISWALMARLGKPGYANRVKVWPLFVPFILLWILATYLVLSAPADQRLAMILGSTWKICAPYIAFLSAPIFVASVWIIRQFAPTRLRLTGAMLGLFSGALAALIYSLHCPELAPSFIVVWYSLGMAIPAVVGALLGQRLLRW